VSPSEGGRIESQRLVTEFANVVIEFTSVQKCLKVFEGVQRHSKVFVDVCGCL
jgi:hypothetical protein